MSPLLRPDLAAGLPFATSATMTCPVGEYRSHAPLQAVALPTHDAWASAPAALAFSCAHCERTISDALTPVEGIRSVQVDILEKQVRVDYDEARVSVDRMKDVLHEEDYPVASAS